MIDSHATMPSMQLVTIVPVLARPQNVEPFVKSWLTGGQPGRLVFVAEMTDYEERAALQAHAAFGSVDVIETWDAHTWPEKVCVGYEEYKGADWYLLAADDVTFTPGWWQATKDLRADKTVGVIGTNDMANPRVLAGEHTTHPLMRGSYIEQQGTVDQPGRPVHDGYRHVFVDDEVVWTAKMRGAWAFCEDAKIVHHHPMFSPEVPWDATYQEGNNSAVWEHDLKLFKSRAPLFGVEIVE